MGKSKTQTTTSALDPQSQAYVDQQRQQAQQAAQTAQNGGPYFTGPQTQSVADQAAAFFNPYQKNVIDANNAQYDKLRAGAMTAGSQQATLAGAYGGTRQSVLQGTRLAALDQSQMSQNADLLNQGWSSAVNAGVPYAEQQRQLQEQKMQEPLFRAQHAQQFMNLGMGPTGGTSTSQESGNVWSTLGDLTKTAAGAAATYYGAKGGKGGPQGGGYSPLAPQGFTPPAWNQNPGLTNPSLGPQWQQQPATQWNPRMRSML